MERDFTVTSIPVWYGFCENLMAETTLAMTICRVKRTNLVGSNGKGVNVTLFCGVAVLEVKLPWVKQFGGLVTDNP